MWLVPPWGRGRGCHQLSRAGRPSQVDGTSVAGVLDQLAYTQQAVAPLGRRYDDFTQVLNVLVPALESSDLLANLRPYVEALLATRSSTLA